jgi:flavin reductase (DIM6/NTAB) family NADH-FMN oxidoreductase RutF
MPRKYSHLPPIDGTDVCLHWAVMEPGSVAEAVDAFTGRNDPPLYVVTVGTPDGELSGCLAGFVTQCSISPPRFLICLSKLNHTYGVGARSATVALHLLGRDQLDLASLFAERTGDTFDKFEHCRWGLRGGEAPVLEACAAWLRGPILDRFDVGDHEALLMSPTDGGAGGADGLLTLQGIPRDLHPGHPAEP